MEELLTLKDLEDKFKVKRDLITNEIKKGRLAGTKIGKLWRFTPQAVQAYVKLRTNETKKSIPTL